MSEKIQSSLDVFAAFCEAFLRRSGCGILDGVKIGSRLIGEFATVALATYFVFQLIDAQKVCEIRSPTAQELKLDGGLIPTP